MIPVKAKEQYLIPKNARVFTIAGDTNSITTTTVGGSIIQLSLQLFSLL